MAPPRLSRTLGTDLALLTVMTTWRRLAMAVVVMLVGGAPGAYAQDSWTEVPQHPEYWALQQAFRDYSTIAGNGGWPQVPDSATLRLEPAPHGAGSVADQQNPAAAEILGPLCRRLAITGDFVEGVTGEGCDVYQQPTARYDAALEAAVRRFQWRMGLTVDGIVGPRTRAALNVPVEDRLRQLAINLDRWRRTPDLGEVHVRVNLAGFQLTAVDRGEPVLSMRVVVGTRQTPTPVMTDAITYLVFRPYWNVPQSISSSEILPKVAADPSYLTRGQYEVVEGFGPGARVVDPSAIDWSTAQSAFPYRIRQRPGPSNSLGLVKFMFPNDEAVYLHHTPATHLFERPLRAYSHGCVRVEDPVALAAFLLRHDPQWSRETIAAAMNGGEQRVVPLGKPVAVHLLYFTAWADAEAVHFREDIYGLDRDHALLRLTDNP